MAVKMLLMVYTKIFPNISLVQPDPQSGPYDKGDYVGDEEGEIAMVLLCWIVLAVFPAVTETAAGAVPSLQSPLRWRGHVDPGAPVPQKILQRHLSLTD